MYNINNQNPTLKSRLTNQTTTSGFWVGLDTLPLLFARSHCILCFGAFVTIVYFVVLVVLISLLFELHSSLNGPNGEWTSSDDVDDRKRAQKEAANKRRFGSVGNCHKAKEGPPSLRLPRESPLCANFLTEGRCIVPGCQYLHNRGTPCPHFRERGVCVIPECPHTHQIVEEEDVVLPPPVPNYTLTSVSVPSDRSPYRVLKNSVFKRCFFFCLLIYSCDSFLFWSDQTVPSFFYEFPVLLLLVKLMSEARLLGSLAFTISLLLCDEASYLVRLLKYREYNQLTDYFRQISVWRFVIGTLLIINLMCSFAVVGDFLGFFGVVACMYVVVVLLWWECFEYQEPVLFGDRIEPIQARLDVDTWSYKSGGVSVYNARVVEPLSDKLLFEFASSDASVDGTFRRMVYSGSEFARGITVDGEPVRYDDIINTVKYAQQKLRGSQLSCMEDGGLKKRPLVLPIQ